MAQFEHTKEMISRDSLRLMRHSLSVVCSCRGEDVTDATALCMIEMVCLVIISEVGSCMYHPVGVVSHLFSDLKCFAWLHVVLFHLSDSKPQPTPLIRYGSTRPYLLVCRCEAGVPRFLHAARIRAPCSTFGLTLRARVRSNPYGNYQRNARVSKY